MQQIHNVVVSFHERWVLDPELGQVKRREQVSKASDVGRIVHDGETYEVQDDGSFLVPDEVAAALTRQPGWFEGPSPFAPERPAQQTPPAPAPRKPQATPSASSAPTS